MIMPESLQSFIKYNLYGTYELHEYMKKINLDK